MKKLKVRIDGKVDNIIKRIDKELNGSQEFSAFLVADRTDVWTIKDLIVPKQSVSGASVSIPQIEGKSQYETTFMDYFKNKPDKIIIGTMHSHNSMGSFHSGTDDEDVNNNSYINLNAGFPFIDIVWSHKECKAWVVLKVNNGMGKQVFTVSGEDVELEFLTSNEAAKVIEDIIKRYEGYDIDLEMLSKSITPKIDIKSMMENIEETKTSYYSGKCFDDYGYGFGYGRYGGYGRDVKEIATQQKLIFEEDMPQIHIEFWKKKHCIAVKVKNDEERVFLECLESWLLEDEETGDMKIVSVSSEKKQWMVCISCKDKERYDKVKPMIQTLFDDMVGQWEDYLESNSLEEENIESAMKDQGISRKEYMDFYGY